MKKFLIILLISFSLFAERPPFELRKTFNEYNQTFIYIHNNTLREAYCTITAENYFVDFYIRGNSSSRIYLEPYGYYQWRCW